ncbi:hypothetical protein [Lysinibacillus sphaericus]|uniref:hypothetical protein n=1 Tax=Lysinibacillus sphaericus TaxID=1421 RepID=UPI001CBE9C3A|nr:hypothetical protein [Lysinibacillus sphaericus]
MAILSVALDSFRRFDDAFRRFGGLFRRFDDSFRRSGGSFLHFGDSIRRFGFVPSL